MITTFEAGAVFKIVDQATPVLRSLARATATLDKNVTKLRLNLEKLGAIKLAPVVNEFRLLGDAAAAAKPELSAVARSLGTVDRRLSTLAATAGASRSAISGAFGAMSTGAASALADVRALTAEWRALALSVGATSRALRIPGRGVYGRPGGGGHGGGRGFHVSSIGAPLPGHMHARVHAGSNVAMAGLGALAYGVYEEAEIEDIAARALMTGQIHVDAGMTGAAAFQKIRSVIQKNAALGGFSPKEVGEAILGSERQFAGLHFNKRMDVLSVLLPAAMQEARFKETGLKEAGEALVGLAHMTGTYDPAKLPELYRKFNFASMITPASLPEFTRALSYSMPSLVAGMGMDPDAIMFLTAMNQAAGIRSSKAGTWVQAFFGKLMPATGINLTRSAAKHNEALRSLGLLGTDNEPTWMVKGAGGKTDWLASLLKLSPLLGQHLRELPETQRLQMLDQVFGKQGGREAGLTNLPEFIAQFPRLAQLMATAPGGEGFLAQLGEGSPVQQARTAFADLSNVLMDIGSVVLPPLTAGLRDFDMALKTTASLFPSTTAAPTDSFMGGLNKALGRGMAEGGTVGVIGGAGVGALFGGIGAGPGAVAGGLGGAFIGGAYEGGKYIWRYLTSPGAIMIQSSSTPVNVDGQKLAELVTKYQVKQAGGPPEGAPYHDSTLSTAPLDYAIPY